MLKLYTSDYCSYCTPVEATLRTLGLEYERLDVQVNPTYRKAVITMGGKMQIPFLVDEEAHVSMYESLDIVDYLTKHYGPKQEQEA